MIIDAHCHAGHGDLMTAPWNTVAPLGPYLRRARTAGITKTIIFSLFHTDNEVANAEVARLVAANPESLIGFLFLHSKHDAGRVGPMVRRAVEVWGFRGIKLHGFEGMPTREICEAARRYRLPVLIDVVGKTHIIDMCAPQYPDVNFIVPHLGSFAGDFRAHQQTIDLLVRYPNVYADSSSVRHFDYLVQAVKRAGPRKLIFGTDGPWLHPAVELAKIKLLRLSPDEERLVVAGNILRLLAPDRRKADYAKERAAARNGSYEILANVP
jgi:predicted TIM-barrel fold metal-dependent hydrolase